MKDYNLIAIRPVGRSGSYFLQNLFDSHPDILSFPFPFPFYYHWYIFHKETREFSVEELVNYYLAKTCLRFLFKGHSNKFSFLYSYSDKNGQEIEYKIDYDKYRKNIKEELDKIGSYPTRKQFLIILHDAYAKTVSLNIENKKFILLHEHYAYRIQDTIEDFPDVKNITTVRDLRNSYSSYIKKNESYHGYLSPLYMAIDLNDTVNAYVNSNLFEKKYPANHRFIKTESLNSNPNSELESLVLWIGINFHPILLEPTYAGHKKDGISVFEKNQKGFDQQGLSQKRWVSICSKREISLLDTVHYDFNIRFGYQMENSRLSGPKFILSALRPDFEIFEKRYKSALSKIIYFLLLNFFWTRYYFVRNYFAVKSNKYLDPPPFKNRILNVVFSILGVN